MLVRGLPARRELRDLISAYLNATVFAAQVWLQGKIANSNGLQFFKSTNYFTEVAGNIHTHRERLSYDLQTSRLLVFSIGRIVIKAIIVFIFIIVIYHEFSSVVKTDTSSSQRLTGTMKKSIVPIAPVWCMKCRQTKSSGRARRPLKSFQLIT